MSKLGFGTVWELFASAGLGSVEEISPLAGGENSQVLEVRCTAPDKTLQADIRSLSVS